MTTSELIEKLKINFKISDEYEQKPGLDFITVPKNEAVILVSTLKELHGYKHLNFFSVIDYIEDGKFKLIYMLNNLDTKHNLGVHCYIDRENATMDSIHHLWKQAGTYQREMKEMYGIDYPGSPRLNDFFLLDKGWDGPPPMKRDFNTKEYSEKTYFQRGDRKTYDPGEYMRQKLYPDFPKEPIVSNDKEER